jgi:tetratricopeptide (TPR) repeat protein/DNA-binding CsgD family transcriptional regulator
MMAVSLVVIISNKPAFGQLKLINNGIDSIQKLIGKAEGERKLSLEIDYASLFGVKDSVESFHLLKEVLQASKQNDYPEVELKALLYLAHYYNGLGKLKEATEVTLQRIEVARAHGNQAAEAYSEAFIFRFYLDQQMYGSAAIHLDRAEKLYLKMEDNTGVGMVLDKRGMAYLMKGSYQQANEYFNRALEYLEKGDSTYMIGITNYHLGYSYFYTGDYQLALIYMHHTIELWEKLNNVGLAPRWNALEMLGNIYFNLRQYDKAMNYHRQALAVRKTAYEGVLADSINLSYAYSYSNIADCYLEMNQPDSALWYAEIALHIKLRPATVASTHDIANSFLNTSKALFRLKYPDKAIGYAESALHYYGLCGWKDGIAESKMLLAEQLASQGQNKLAMQNLQDALQVAQEINAKLLQKKIYWELADLYSSMGDYLKSNEALMKYSQLKDSLFNTDMNQKIAEVEIKYEVNKKELENDFLRTQFASQKKQQFYLYLIIGLFLLLLPLLGIMAWLLKRNLRHKEAVVVSQRMLSELKETQYKQEIEQKNMELYRLVNSIKNKNGMLDEVKEIMMQEIKENCNAPVETFQKTVKTIQSHIVSDQDWELMDKQIEELSSGFTSALLKKHPALSPGDLKLCAFIRLNLSVREISSLLNITEESVHKHRYRLRKKLGLNGDSLEVYLNGY